VKISVIIGALFAASANAFTTTPVARRFGTIQRATVESQDRVDGIGNNVAVKEILFKVESSGLLSKVAQSGLLSKAQEAGVSLSNLEPLLDLAAENPDILILVEASGPELISILPTIVDLAPPILPLLAFAVGIPPTLLLAGALASVAATAGIVIYVPDDTIINIALQTVAAATLGVVVPAASVAGAVALGKLTE